MKTIKMGLWVFTALFVLMGIFMVVQATGSQSWQQTTATIIAAEVKKNTHIQKVNNHVYVRTDYSVTARYQYTFKGKEYTGSRYSIGTGDSISGSFQKKSEAEKWLKNSPYRIGESITIHVNPEEPSEAIISNTIDWPAFVPFIVAALFMFLAILVGVLEKRANANKAGLST